MPPVLALIDDLMFGFLSHVNADAARQATALGCTRVLARSAFVQELPGLLAAAVSAR